MHSTLVTEIPVINLIVRGKDLVQGMVGIAMACYVARLRSPQGVHRRSRASPISARSPRERGYWRLRTPGAKSLALFGDVADQPEEWIAADERELANGKPGRHAHAGASAAGLQAERCGKRGILDERIHLRDALEMLPVATLHCFSRSPTWTVSWPRMLAVPDTKSVSRNSVARAKLGDLGP